jgi:hypothetical protein
MSLTIWEELPLCWRYVVRDANGELVLMSVKPYESMFEALWDLQNLV